MPGVDDPTLRQVMEWQAQQLAERARRLQADPSAGQAINAAGFDLEESVAQLDPGSQAVEIRLVRCWARLWKLIAKEYREEIGRLSVALLQGHGDCDLIAGELRLERDQARQYAEALEAAQQAARRRAAAAEQMVNLLRRDLLEFGDHSRNCQIHRRPGLPCNCGFAQALEVGKGGS